jgi:hypothetical protein
MLIGATKRWILAPRAGGSTEWRTPVSEVGGLLEGTWVTLGKIMSVCVQQPSDCPREILPTFSKETRSYNSSGFVGLGLGSSLEKSKIPTLVKGIDVDMKIYVEFHYKSMKQNRIYRIMAFV